MPSPANAVSRPRGSELIEQWAYRNGCTYHALPEAAWFDAWEPFETMVAPASWFNAISKPYRSGHITIAEPWVADEGFEPMERALVAFVVHPRLRHKASARIGESFLTRVAYVGTSPPPKALVGDPVWDDRAVTFAPLGSDPGAALVPGLRKLLIDWNFAGHIEVRPRGMVLNVAGLRPEPESLDKLIQFVPLAIDRAVDGPDR